MLLVDLDNTLKPNLELFESLRFSSTSLGKMPKEDQCLLESDAYNVVEFFRTHGFKDQQISDLTMKHPTFYLFNAHKIIKPKFKFFKYLGLSDQNLKLQRLFKIDYCLWRSSDPS